MGFNQKKCKHLATIKNPKIAASYECQECVAMGSNWLHLRTCQECGITLCCDSSPNKHARKHAHRKKHLVISSAEPKEFWMYCYHDKITVTYREDTLK